MKAIDRTRISAKEGVPDIFLRDNTIFVLNCSNSNNQAVFNLPDRHSTQVKFFKGSGYLKMSEYLDANVIACLINPFDKTPNYFLANADADNLQGILSLIVETMNKQKRVWIEEAIISAAYNEPEFFKQTILEPTSNEGDGSNSNILSNLGRVFLGLGLGAVYGITPDFDFDGSGITDDLSIGGEDLSDSGISIERQPSMSAKRKREILSTLPDKLSDRFTKKNPESIDEVMKIIKSVSHEDLQSLVLELAKHQKGVLSIFNFEKISSASEYELCLIPWNNKIADFDSKYYYCLFIKDGKGKLTPVKFKNHPSYCLYIMYVLDRAKRKDEASYLSLKTNKSEFCRLYQTLFGVPKVDAEKKYETFAYRLTKQGDLRKGRYDDYLHDIDETIVSLVGELDSIPLKLRSGGHLEILPEKIHFDKIFNEFNFR